jgi:hypothetical protein
MFELNDNITIKEYLVEDSYVYIVDNFYKNPEEIVNFLLENEPEFHKIDEYPSFNSIYFEDRRHFIESDEVIKVYEYLSKICKQNISSNGNEIITNFFKLNKNSFNDYINNYWFPHTDYGYTAIIYLNENDFYSGTNLYKNLNPSEYPPTGILQTPEHYEPWKNKKNFELIHSIEPKYNRMVLFDGFKFFHGMNICNHDYFEETYRMNQVLFFQDANYIDD